MERDVSALGQLVVHRSRRRARLMRHRIEPLHQELVLFGEQLDHLRQITRCAHRRVWLGALHPAAQFCCLHLGAQLAVVTLDHGAARAHLRGERLHAHVLDEPARSVRVPQAVKGADLAVRVRFQPVRLQEDLERFGQTLMIRDVALSCPKDVGVLTVKFVLGQIP